MTATTRQHFYIFDHPESKIRFLESSLRDDEWRTTIVIPAAETTSPQQRAIELAGMFKERGYVTSHMIDANGAALLHVHHLSPKSDFLEIMREMGVVRGTIFTLEHLGALTSHTLVQCANFFSYVVREPARLFSGIYLAGDAFMTFAEMAQKKHPITSGPELPTSRLGTIGKTIGTLGTLGNWAQSLIYLKWAKSGAEINFADLKDAFETGQKNGIEATNFKAWTDPKLREHFLSPITDVAKRNPIETGAWAMVASQLAFITTRGIDMALTRPLLKGQPMPTPRDWLKLLKVNDIGDAAETQKIFGKTFSYDEQIHLGAFKRTLGSSINLLRAGLSIAGWQLLTRAHPHHDTVTPWTENPFKRALEVVDNHTEQVVGGMTAAASMVGITAAAFSGNRWQMAGEFIWLAGDCIVFLFDKENYGQANAKLEMPLIESATKFLKAMPVALGPSAEKQMIHDLACHLASRTVQDGQRKIKLQDPVKIEEETAKLSTAIEAGLNANMASHRNIFRKIAYESAVIAGKFGAEQGPAVAQKIAETLAKTPSLNATRAEWEEAITKAMDKTVVDDKSIRTIGQLTNDIAQLVLISPAAANTGVAMAIYDGVASFLPRDPHGVTALNHAITAQASKQLNLTPEEIAAMQQTSNVNPPPLIKTAAGR